MENEYMKRGYLLPEGCKDLIDVWKVKGTPKPSTPKSSSAAALPPVIGDLVVPAGMTVSELAASLTQKPFQIIADLMELGIFANLKDELGFETISKVVRKYGFIAKRAA